MLFNLAPNYGAGGGTTVQLPEYDGFGNVGSESLVYSGIRFGSDGKIYRMTSGGSWQWSGEVWLNDGLASDYYLSRTLVTGFPSAVLESDSGTLQQMNANLDYYRSTSSGLKTVNIDFTISDDPGGTPILVSNSYQLSCERSF